jgi:hypothetical protein
MSVYSPSRATAYKEQSILTATPGQLAAVQAELTATLAAARAEIAREIASLPKARGAVAGYAAAQAAPSRGWVNDQA